VLGAGFGMLKALLIAATDFMLISLLYDLVYGAREARPDWMTQSRTYPLLSATSVALSDIIAERLDDTPAQADATSSATPAP
jgi:membrane protein required for colicin V production